METSISTEPEILQEKHSEASESSKYHNYSQEKEQNIITPKLKYIIQDVHVADLRYLENITPILASINTVWVGIRCQRHTSGLTGLN